MQVLLPVRTSRTSTDYTVLRHANAMPALPCRSIDVCLSGLAFDPYTGSAVALLDQQNQRLLFINPVTSVGTFTFICIRLLNMFTFVFSWSITRIRLSDNKCFFRFRRPRVCRRSVQTDCTQNHLCISFAKHSHLYLGFAASRVEQ